MKLIVNPHKIEIIKEPVNEREIDITKCEFEFADEITNDYVKEAYFTFKGNTYKQIIFNNECDIPSEVLTEKGQVEIGVVAFLVQNEEEIKRYNPSSAYFNTWVGSLKDNAENSEPITPSEIEQYEQELQNGLSIVNGKITDINQALTEVDNLNIDANKVETTTTVEITKKDGTKTSVEILDGHDGSDGEDGIGIDYDWENTSLGIKKENEEEYEYVNLKGDPGENGYTPQKGVDYWTNEEKQEIVSNASTQVEADIQPILATKADKSQIPTKTSDLDNDSNFAKTNQNNNFTAGQTINGNLTVNGDISQIGSTYETHAEQVFTKDNYIVLRDGATGGLGNNEYAGFEAIKYDGTNNGRLVFDNTGTARVGDVGDEIPLLARDETSNMVDNQVLIWDDAHLKAKTSFRVVTLTEAQYNALQTKDNNTYYLIEE